MKLCLRKTRFPEDIRQCTPLLIGCRGDKFVVLFDADVDGYQKISRGEAEAIIEDLAGCSLEAFIKIAQYQDLIVKA